jgi:hypothetical protein
VFEPEANSGGLGCRVEEAEVLDELAIERLRTVTHKDQVQGDD